MLLPRSAGVVLDRACLLQWQNTNISHLFYTCLFHSRLLVIVLLYQLSIHPHISQINKSTSDEVLEGARCVLTGISRRTSRLVPPRIIAQHA